MQVKVQLIVCADDGLEETVQEIAVVEKDCHRIEQIGLTLAEAKALLATLQQQVVERQAAEFLATRTHCQTCGAPLSTKGHHTLTFRTLFGTVALPSPRVRHCRCTPHAQATFSPLVDLLPERTAPELLFMETKWASLMFYGLTAQVMWLYSSGHTEPRTIIPLERCVRWVNQQ
jgi:hypothetical protein